MTTDEKINVEQNLVTPWNLSIYYRRIFPSHIYCKWLAYGEPSISPNFSQREFSFTLENEIYRRYLSFSNHIEFEKELIKCCPNKIDIGAVYSAKPKDHKLLSSNKFYPIERELVFDVDMTDYDDVRFCCRGADICSKCWRLMNFAMDIIDSALHEDFGFEHRLWVYSGRRGVHCWVCDQTARELQSTNRQSIVEYLTVVTNGKDSTKRVNLSYPLHPCLQRARDRISSEFDRYACIEQDFLGDQQRIDRFLRLVPDESRQILKEIFSQLKSSAERWSAFKQHIESIINSTSNNNKNRKSSYPTLIDEILFEYCYPRLDGNVTKGMNHLLKSPFSIHPKTGQVSIPIDINCLSTFDPCQHRSLPTLNKLCQQIEIIQKQNQSTDKTINERINTKQKDWINTDLKPFVEYFSRFVQSVKMLNQDEIIEQSDLNTILSGDI